MAIKRAASRSRPLTAGERAKLTGARSATKNRTARCRLEAESAIKSKNVSAKRRGA